MSDWKSRFAVIGVAASALLAAKALRQLWLFAELGLLAPPVRKFKGEWALVTGGSEGVGKAIAAELARHGVNVLLVSRSQAKLDAAAAEINSKHPNVQVRTYAADLTQRASLEALLQHITAGSTSSSDVTTASSSSSSSAISVSLLVANAGGAVPRFTSYWDYSDEDEAAMQALNGTACYVLVKKLLPNMVKRGKGAVVAISSLSHKIGAFAAPYGAEKAKINALCSFLHHELKGSGVTAQAMVLGAVVTPGLTAFMGPRKPAAAADNAAASGNSSSDNAAGSSSSGSSSGSSSAAIIKPTLTMPSAEAAAAAIVRNIGRGGPVVTPFWGHALSEVLLLDGWWPPELQRAVVGRIARSIKGSYDARVAITQSG